MDIISFLLENKVVILGALLAISEVLALIPSVKSNGLFDFLIKLIKSAKEG